MAGHGNHGNGEGVVERRINHDDAFYTSAQQHLTVLFHQMLFPPMMGRKVEVPGIHQLIANPAYDLVVIGLSQVRYQDSDAQRPPVAKGSCKKAGLIIEFFRGCLNSVTSW